MNLEEQQVIDIFKELLNKYDKQGTREVRDGHSRVSLFGKQLRFDLSKSFPLLTHRQTFMRGTFEELKWFLSGSTDNQVLKDKGVNYWTRWEGIVDKNNPTNLGLIYGHQWRNFGATDLDHIIRPYTTECLELKGFDQIEWVVNEIKTNPSSSRLIVSGWNPSDSLALDPSTKKPKAVLPTCHTLFQFFVEKMSDEERVNQATEHYGHDQLIDLYTEHIKNIDSNRALEPKDIQDLLDSLSYPRAKLSCQLYQRSSDISIAGNINIACYALLTHMVAQQCDLAVGEFIWTLGDYHLYGNQVDDVREMVARETHPFPTIKIKKAKDLYSYEWSDIEIINYKHSGKMENLKVAV